MPFSVNVEKNMSYFCNDYLGVVDNGVQKPFFDSLDSLLQDASYLIDLIKEHREMMDDKFLSLRIQSLDIGKIEYVINLFVEMKSYFEQQVGEQKLSASQLENEVELFCKKYPRFSRNDFFLTQDQDNHLQINIVFNKKSSLMPIFQYRMTKIIKNDQMRINQQIDEKNIMYESLLDKNSSGDYDVKYAKVKEYENNLNKFITDHKNFMEQLEQYGNGFWIRQEMKLFDYINELKQQSNLTNTGNNKNNLSTKRNKFLNKDESNHHQNTQQLK